MPKQLPYIVSMSSPGRSSFGLDVQRLPVTFGNDIDEPNFAPNVGPGQSDSNHWQNDLIARSSSPRTPYSSPSVSVLPDYGDGTERRHSLASLVVPAAILGHFVEILFEQTIVTQDDELQFRPSSAIGVRRRDLK